MTRPSKHFLFVCVGVLLAATSGLRAAILSPALSAKGAEAKTLVIYTSTHAPYSLANDLVALKVQIRRVATQVEEVDAAHAEPVRIAAADYVVVFCPQPFPTLPKPLLQAIAQSQHPVLWVGYGADNLEHLPPFE